MTINILLLTHVLPYPLDAGPKVRAYYMLRHLSQRHEVTLVSFVRAADRPEYVAHLAQHCRAVHTVPIRRSTAANIRAGLPIVIARDDSAEMATLLLRLTSETPFDLIHADQLSMAPWAQQAAKAIHTAQTTHTTEADHPPIPLPRATTSFAPLVIQTPPASSSTPTTPSTS